MRLIESPGELPILEIPIEDLENGIDVLDVAIAAGFCNSRTQARKAIRHGAIRVNDVVITDELLKITMEDLRFDV